MTGAAFVCRAGVHCDQSTLQGVMRHMVHHQVLAPKQIADLVPCGYAYLLATADEQREDVQFQTRLIEGLTAATGDTALVDFFIRRTGRVAYPLPALNLAEPQRTTTERVTNAIGDFGDLLRSITNATAPDSPAGGSFTAVELLTIEQMGERAIAAIAYAVATVRHQAGGGQ